MKPGQTRMAQAIAATRRKLVAAKSTAEQTNALADLYEIAFRNGSAATIQGFKEGLRRAK